MEESYSLCVSNYAGHENEILDFRNRNRRVKKSREYLDWRYIGEPAVTPPLIFGLPDGTGARIAMASLIFRSYFVNGENCHFGVLGDIAVDQAHRGKELSTQLFRHINTYIDQRDLHSAFVMPNLPAQRGLSSAGWRTVGRLIPIVCLIRPEEKIRRVLRLAPPTKLLSRIAQKLLLTTVSAAIHPNISLRPVPDFDEDFQTFWINLPKEKLVIRDRDLATLNWRYRKQPGQRYSIIKFYNRMAFIGYLIFSISENNGACMVSDFVVRTLEFVRPCMALFMKSALADERISTIRMTLNDKGSYAPLLKRLGFLARKPVTVFQTYNSLHPLMSDSRAWFVTDGDKDA